MQCLDVAEEAGADTPSHSPVQLRAVRDCLTSSGHGLLGAVGGLFAEPSGRGSTDSTALSDLRVSATSPPPPPGQRNSLFGRLSGNLKRGRGSVTGSIKRGRILMRRQESLMEDITPLFRQARTAPPPLAPPAPEDPVTQGQSALSARSSCRPAL